MITGLVTGMPQALVRLRLRGPQGVEAELEAVVDTGFSEEFAVSRTWVEALKLPYQEDHEIILADGSVIPVTLHQGVVLWDGQERDVVVHCLEGEPLIGMSLLDGHLLSMQVVDGGAVTIVPLP